jgi:peptidoglycan/xylan/chitin deacetylase (PgdA/CDA1 family)
MLKKGEVFTMKPITSYIQAKNEIMSVKRSYRDMKPSFCFTDDDISSKVITVLKPILDARGIKPTLAVITGMLGDSGKLTQSQILDLYNERWEMASHTHNHITLDGVALTNEDIDYQLSTSKSYLESIGIKCDTLIYPEGKYNKKVVDIAKKYYKCALRTGDVVGTYPISTYGIERLSIGAWGISDWPTIQATIDSIIAKNQLCVIGTHIGPNTTEQNALVEQTLDYIIGLGYVFQTFSEAYENHKNILEHGAYSEVTDQVEFAVGANGLLGGTGANHIVRLEANTVNNTTTPEKFPNNKISFCRISHSNRTGFPSDTQGVLMTNTLGNTPTSFNIWQEYQGIQNNTIYRRYAINKTTWTPWVQSVTKTRYTHTMTSILVPANSTLNVDTITGLSDTNSVIVMPQYGSPTGIMYNAYIDGAGLLKIRLENTTAADITVSKTWLIDIIK